MGINEAIYNGIKKNLYGKYYINNEDVEEFLIGGLEFPKRRDVAIKTIGMIMKAHNKQKLLGYLVELKKIETGIGGVEPWVRDHVVHSLLTFLLGIYIQDGLEDKGKIVGVTPFQWKLAGLFHDVGYPTQIGNDILRQFSASINNFSKELDVDADSVGFNPYPINFENLTNNQNSLSLIQHQYDTWNITIDVEKEYISASERGYLCHGMMSALSLIRVVDLMYQKYNPKRERKDVFASDDWNVNWNQEYFYQDVIPATAAIFLHNLPAEVFNGTKLEISQAPLAYLLRLCDSIQDWERPSELFKEGFPGENYEIDFTSDVLVLHTALSDDRKKKIESDIFSALAADWVKIENS